MLRLGVNIDHVATVRNARGGAYPDPVRAALLAAEAGADGITAHLREDRRHITDDDIARLSAELTIPLNLEMAATDEMLAIALRHRPHAACIVPEKREERTTEGGIDAAGQHNRLAPMVARARRDAASACRCSSSRTRARSRPRCGSARRWSSCTPGAMPSWTGDGAGGRTAPPGGCRGAGGEERDRGACRARPDLSTMSPPIAAIPQVARAQHRAFPDRRGDVRRARRSGPAHARGDGRGAVRRKIGSRRRGDAEKKTRVFSCLQALAARSPSGLDNSRMRSRSTTAVRSTHLRVSAPPREPTFSFRGSSHMIIGLGSDLCNIERIQASLDRFGARFEQRASSPRSSAPRPTRARSPRRARSPSGSPPRRRFPRRSEPGSRRACSCATSASSTPARARRRSTHRRCQGEA